MRDTAMTPAAAAPPLLEFRNISKRYGAVRALVDVSLDLRPGEVHALLGQNGAGKSTLIKVLAGVVAKDGGSIRVNGEPSEFRTPSGARDAGIAVVYQELSLVPSMSVADNIFLNREPSRFGIVDRRTMREKARRFLDDHGFNLDPAAIVGTLPFAYRQLTEIAKALMGNVRILVLDEPTSSLSSEEEATLFGAVEELTKKGVGVIYVTHRLGEVFRLAQRVTVLRDGRDVETCNTAESDIPSLVRAIVGPKASATAPSDATREGVRDDAPVVVELTGVSNDRLDRVDFQVRAGEILGLAGMIGSGRTEILETIFGLRKVRQGRISLKGRPVAFRSPIDAIRSGVALVPEDRHRQGLVLDHAIERNISMAHLPGLSRFGWFRRRLAAGRAGEAMRDLSIKAPATTTPARALSGGNQQKVVFGKWLHPTPDVLLLDEPTVGVDVGAREQIYALVRNAARAGSAVVVVSSDIGELAMLCDSVAVVGKGAIKARLSRAEFGGEERLHHLIQELQG